jgi:hypothetical protein
MNALFKWPFVQGWGEGKRHLKDCRFGYLDIEAGVAQLAERQPSKLRVAGSIPVSRSINTELLY